MADNLTRSRGEDFTIQDLANLATRGVLRVPEFQRSFRWEASDVLALFDSILNGYPVGSVLLWKKSAPEAELVLGALPIVAPVVQDALWVVDGQQRITSLVNAVSPLAFEADDRFRIYYLVEQSRLVRSSESRGQLAIPLPDLFDVSRLLAWLQENPEARDHASVLQDTTARIRDFRLPASIVDQANEDVLRDIFDRMNTAGKRLRSAEIFDAIHRADGEATPRDLSIGAISDRLAASTTFGRLEEAVIYQALLVRRHPDITRDPHGEFEGERRANSDFPQEDREQSYREAEAALGLAVNFLDEVARVPHVTLLPYRFLLLVLVRYFSLFEPPTGRRRELLSRWFWMAATRAPALGFFGSTANVRSLAGLLVVGDESGSIDRLLKSVKLTDEVEVPDLAQFRTNRAASKVVICSMWARRPRLPADGSELVASQLSAALEGSDSASDIVPELVPRRRLSPEFRYAAANRVLLVPGQDPALTSFLELPGEVRKIVLASHMMEEESLSYLQGGDFDRFVEARQATVREQLFRFIRERTGEGLELTPPLEAFDFDDLDEEDELDRLRTSLEDL